MQIPSVRFRHVGGGVIYGNAIQPLAKERDHGVSPRFLGVVFNPLSIYHRWLI
jgi:hypothetical protein